MPIDRHFRRNLTLYVTQDKTRLRAIVRHAVEEWIKWVGTRAIVGAISRQDAPVAIDIIVRLFSREEADAEIGIDERTGRRCLTTKFPHVASRSTVFAPERDSDGRVDP